MRRRLFARITYQLTVSQFATKSRVGEQVILQDLNQKRASKLYTKIAPKAHKQRQNGGLSIDGGFQWAKGEQNPMRFFS